MPIEPIITAAIFIAIGAGVARPSITFWREILISSNATIASKHTDAIVDSVCSVSNCGPGLGA